MLGITADLALTGPQIWLLSIIVFIVAYNYLAKEPWKKLPPGPPTLPLIGSLPFLGLDAREPLKTMAKRYGNIFTIFLGTRRVVVLNGYDVIKEALVTHAHAFSGRPNTFILSDIGEGHGILPISGHVWQEQRRYTLHVLRDFGFGRSILEDRILEEIKFCIAELVKHTNIPFNPQSTLQTSVANVIASVIFGKRMEYDDPKFVEYMKIFNRSIQIVGNSSLINVMPFLRFLPGDLFHAKNLQKDMNYLNSEYQRIIEEHKINACKGQKRDDFISAYLDKIKEEQNKNGTTFTEKQLVAIVRDLFAAGTETTSTTLTWAIIYMSLDNDIQDRIHAEIDDVIGRYECPRMYHRSQLPLTEASLMEVQRLGDIVPLNVPHSVTADIYLRGYYIPKDTMILPNLNSVHMDPELWPEPDKFHPERFLDDEGKIVKREELIPFSTGKRICLGESLARMELFLYFVTIMQHFRFRVVPGCSPPDTKGILGITNVPKPFHIIMEARPAA